jgi:hypothetical protein
MTPSSIVIDAKRPQEDEGTEMDEAKRSSSAATDEAAGSGEGEEPEHQYPVLSRSTQIGLVLSLTLAMVLNVRCGSVAWGGGELIVFSSLERRLCKSRLSRSVWK